MPSEFISDKAIYDRVIQEMVIEADRYVWIATADIKDLYVKRGNKMVPFKLLMSFQM